MYDSEVGKDMKSFLSKEEAEELESLKQDLVGPVKSFLAEVREDSIGDAKRYYSARARKAQQDVKLAQKRTEERLKAVRQEQEALRRRRKAMMKRASIILALLALFSLVLISAALTAHADAPDKRRTWEAASGSVSTGLPESGVICDRTGVIINTIR